MGRWAQRRRGGGDPKSFTAALLTITDGVLLGGNDIEVNFSGPVSAAGFDASDFESLPSGETSVSYAQGSATSVIVTYTGDVGSDTEGNYTGDKPGIATPQLGWPVGA